ncbi:MAG: carcinine hydrolase/isopenicillin-N N-acyltransferase family protein [bacterium]|nr:carcinine hydrolase/isopenicillin-N N-acyltransferase family protein [bacterium]
MKLKFIDYIFPKLSCTSIYLSSEFVEDKIPVVMKIRDKLPMPQYICKKLNGNRIPYFFSGSISEIGFAFFVKENGLTGINNTGSYMKENFVNEIGFDDCDMMRIIAEYCDDLENIIEIIKKFQKDKIVGCAGKRRGMIFLFAKNEEAILVETNSFNINWKKVKGKLGFTNDFLMKDSQDWIEKLDTEGVKSSLNRKKRIDEILDENDLFNIEKLIRISRDKKYYPYSICRDTKLMPIRTISAYFVYLFPQPIVWITCGSPYVSPFFPFFIKGNKICEDFVSGEVSIKLNIIYERKKLEDEKFLLKITDFENKIREKIVNNEETVEEKNIEIQKETISFIEESLNSF